MNSIGGVQVFAALKDVGTPLKTIPDFEELYEDVFHPEVFYYISTSADAETIEKKISLPDVVTEKEITPIDRLQSGEVAEEEAARTGGGVEAPETAPAAGSGKTAGAAPSAHATEDAQTAGQSAGGGEAAETSTAAEAAGSAPSAEGTGTVPAAGAAGGKGEDASTGGEAQKKQKGVREQELRKGGSSGSVLRVDSRRIDDLLNLVSEAVITKARFNQISQKFSDAQTQMNQAREEYYERLKELFDSMPEYLERIQRGETVKTIKAEILERFGELYSIFDRFDNRLTISPTPRGMKAPYS